MKMLILQAETLTHTVHRIIKMLITFCINTEDETALEKNLLAH